MTKLFIGNMPFNITDDLLRSEFKDFGEITDAIVIKDRETGRSRGFGFITFASPEDAQKAKREMDGQDMDGRPLKVNEANDRGPRGGGGGGGYQGGGGGYRGGGGYQGGGGGYQGGSGGGYRGGGGYKNDDGGYNSRGGGGGYGRDDEYSRGSRGGGGGGGYRDY